MSLILSQTSDNQTIEIPVGTSVGMVLLTKQNCVFEGSDRDTCIIRGDYTNNYTVVFQPSGATPSVSITVRNCTIDLNNHANIISAFQTDSGTLDRITLENVRIIGCNRNGVAILNVAELYCYDVLIEGNGGGIQAHTNSTITELVRVTCRGCKFGFVNSDAGTNRARLTDFRSYHHYWASPTYESADIASIAYNKVIMVSHDGAARSVYDCLRLMEEIGTYEGGNPPPLSLDVERWDRLEAVDGTWSQVLTVGPDGLTIDTWRKPEQWTPATEAPSGTITVWRPILGKLYWTSGNELRLYDINGEVDDPHWRRVDGTRVVLPTATRLDIIRNGLSPGQIKDVDTGGIHITDTAENTTLTRCYVEGGFADMITVRGTNTYAEDCSVYIGQDMAWTVDGSVDRQNLVRCTAEGGGEHGFILINGPSDLTDCNAINNGLHANGSYDATGSGVVVYPEAVGSRVSLVHCYGNYRDNIYGGFLPPLFQGSSRAWRW